MNKQEILNKLQNEFRILELMRLYPEHFIEKYGGKRAYQNEIDAVLDKINFYREQLKNFK